MKCHDDRHNSPLCQMPGQERQQLWLEEREYSNRGSPPARKLIDLCGTHQPTFLAGKQGYGQCHRCWPHNKQRRGGISRELGELILLVRELGGGAQNNETKQQVCRERSCSQANVNQPAPCSLYISGTVVVCLSVPTAGFDRRSRLRKQA